MAVGNQTTSSGPGTATANPPDWAPWRSLLKWDPFKIDALGLVTLLGAEEVNASVGRLVRSVYFEYLPLLGAFVIAGNAFRNKEAGFNLYNITQGIHTTDMAAWLTRWMKSQDFEQNRSLVRWTIQPQEPRYFDDLVSLSLSFCTIGMLIALTLLSYDWYGFATALAMVFSILVRWYLVSSIRSAIDEQVKKAYKKGSETSFETALSDWKDRSKRAGATANGTDTEAKLEVERMPHRLEHGWNGLEPATVLIIMNDAKAVTMITPRELLAPPSVFVANIDPSNRALYGIAGWIGWASFAVQVVTIGMADLATQIVTVVLLVVPTILFVAKLGCDDSKWPKHIKSFFHKFTNKSTPPQEYYGPDWPEFKSECWIGSMLKAEVYEWPVSHEFPQTADGKIDFDAPLETIAEKRLSKRQYLYSWLQLSKPERKSMDKWDLFPHERSNNTDWLDTYKKMTKRIMELQDMGKKWGIKSMQPTLTPPPPPSAPAVETETQLSPKEARPVPPLDTQKTRKPSVAGMKSRKAGEEEPDKADTAQDGTKLDPQSPSDSTSPTHTTAPHTGVKPHTEPAVDVGDNIKPVKRQGTGLSIASTHPTGSAFWMTTDIIEHEEQVEGESSESDGTNIRETTDKPEG
jgi:hypothetical protein